MERSKAILTPNPMLPNDLITIDPEKCIACGYCAYICRCSVLLENPEPGQPPLLVFPEECCHCAACTENCPTGAIQIEFAVNQKGTWKRKDTDQIFRIGMNHPPPPYSQKAYGDRTVYIEKASKITLIVSEFEYVSRSVVRVRLAKVSEEIPTYRAGSFCNVKIGEKQYRGYSISNVYNSEYIELFIDLAPNGPGSKFFSALEKEQKVELSLPYGRFMYTPRETPVFLIGDGAGISPMKAFLEQELVQEKSGRAIQLLFAVWEKEDLFLRHYLEKFSNEYANLTFKVFYSNPIPDSQEKQKISLIDFIKASDFVSEDMDVYICGSNEFVKSIERELFERGVFWRNIFYESFIQ